MKSALLIVLLLSSYMFISTAQGSYGNCCLGHVPIIKKQAKKNVKSYRLQESDGDCNIEAVIFFMKKKQWQKKPGTVCTNPKDQWVQDLMKALDEKQGN